jgi:hypothetical protein
MRIWKSCLPPPSDPFVQQDACGSFTSNLSDEALSYTRFKAVLHTARVRKAADTGSDQDRPKWKGCSTSVVKCHGPYVHTARTIEE